MERRIIGLDFGTDSVRAVVLNADKGTEEASEVALYQRWAAGKYCEPREEQVPPASRGTTSRPWRQPCAGALARLGRKAGESVVAIGIDTTGSTPCAVNSDGTPLALTKGFEENPNAMFVLWKDHTAVREAELINRVARTWGGTDFTKYEGGVYSSEWFWSKILHVLRTDAKVREAAFSWVEHCDWMPALLTGTAEPLAMKRSRCAAGHKAMWHAEWDGLPPEKFLVRVDPLLKGLRERLYTETYTSDSPGRQRSRRVGEAPGPHAGGRPWPWAPSTRTWAAWAARSRADPREDHGHLDLRHARLACPAGRAQDDRRHLRPGRRLHHPRHDRPRSGPVRLRRRVRLVPRPARLAAGGRRARRARDEGRRAREAEGGDRADHARQAGGGSREGRPGRVDPRRPGLAERQAHPVRRPDPEGRDRRAHPRHDGADASSARWWRPPPSARARSSSSSGRSA